MNKKISLVAILSIALVAFFRAKLDGILNDVEETAAIVLAAVMEQTP